MCGIAGKVWAEAGRPVEEELLRAMCAAIAHRGPDDEGIYRQGPAGLGMRRLKVIDLEGGRQPMSNEAGTLWVVFNGEIYNYLELRRELEGEGCRFRTHSDTETILHLYQREGPAGVRRLRGMFALALWDRDQQTLMLARDRLGKKPLYYAHRPEGLSFASELNALLCDPQVDRSVDRRAIDEYLSFLFVPQPRTIYEQVRKLPPATYALYRAGRLELYPYWQIRYDQVRERSLAECAEELDQVLRRAVELRLLADVPVGAFLSGGLDSSLVVALMQQVGQGQVRTFSIGFREASFSELDQARQVARALGTQHQEYVVDYQVQELLPGLLDHFGEPFADSSAIPTYHLSRLTRQQVTVALSGDGGDEVFGGYRRYLARRWAELFNRWPAWLGRGGVEGLGRVLREPATYYGHSRRKQFKRFLEYAAALREAPQTSWGFFLPRRKERTFTGKILPIYSTQIRAT
ncbi:MAG: asparagine synthase (glutamine-hydrolyzing) [Candidatus Handelsmanbacteria bacterium]|nr:asparagine synthase (glutamine-hydrolyzing) [Candidatus Handelsmanbacteria bacterium]